MEWDVSRRSLSADRCNRKLARIGVMSKVCVAVFVAKVKDSRRPIGQLFEVAVPLEIVTRERAQSSANGRETVPPTVHCCNHRQDHFLVGAHFQRQQNRELVFEHGVFRNDERDQLRVFRIRLKWRRVDGGRVSRKLQDGDLSVFVPVLLRRFLVHLQFSRSNGESASRVVNWRTWKSSSRFGRPRFRRPVSS